MFSLFKFSHFFSFATCYFIVENWVLEIMTNLFLVERFVSILLGGGLYLYYSCTYQGNQIPPGSLPVAWEFSFCSPPTPALRESLCFASYFMWGEGRGEGASIHLLYWRLGGCMRCKSGSWFLAIQAVSGVGSLWWSWPRYTLSWLAIPRSSASTLPQYILQVRQMVG